MEGARKADSGGTGPAGLMKSRALIVADEHEVTVLEVTVLAVRGSAHAAYTIVGGLQW